MIIRFALMVGCLALTGCRGKEGNSTDSAQGATSHFSFGNIEIGMTLAEVKRAYPAAECGPDLVSEVDGAQSCSIADFQLGEDKLPLNVSIESGVVIVVENLDLAAETAAQLRKVFLQEYGPPTLGEREGDEIWSDGSNVINLNQSGQLAMYTPHTPTPVAQVETIAEGRSGPCASSPIVVKGLCMGMPLTEAITSLETQLDTKLSLYPGMNLGDPQVQFISNGSDLIIGGFAVEVRGTQGALSGLVLKSAAVGKLFNASDMSPDAFAQAFVDAYSIANMNGTIQQIQYQKRWVAVKTWTHRYDDTGITVEIMAVEGLPAKSVTIIAGTKAAERSFN